MKNLIVCILCFVLLSACQEKAPHPTIHLDEVLFSTFKQKVLPDYLETRFTSRWIEQYDDLIKAENPSYRMEWLDAAAYLIVPSINIPAEQLAGFESNILNELDKGELSINNGQLLVFHNDSMLLKFVIVDDDSSKSNGLWHPDFSPYLRKIPLSTFEQATSYFVITITQENACTPVPGIFIKLNGEYRVMSPNGTMYPLNEMYKPFYGSQKELDAFLKRMIKIVSNQIVWENEKQKRTTSLLPF